MGRTRVRRKPLLEILEARWVPATLNLTAGVLAYTAVDGETNALSVDVVPIQGVNSVRIRETGAGVTLTVTGSGLTADSTTQAHAAASAVTSIIIRTGDRADTVTIGLSDLMPASLTILALDSIYVDQLNLIGTAGDDTISLDTYRFPGDFNNTDSPPEDGQKGIEITRGASSIKEQGITSVSVDVSGAGADLLKVDRYITGADRPVTLNVVGGGAGKDTLVLKGGGSILHPQNLPQSVSLSDGQITVDDSVTAPEVLLGRSDNIAIDQPRAVIEIIDDSGDEPVSLGPLSYNTFLLDTGASGVLFAAESTAELNEAGYQTDGIYMEQGVAGFTQFDVSKPYRVDYAGGSGERNTLENFRIESSTELNFSFLGPWGILGMPAMVNKVVSLDMSRWSNIQDIFEDLNIKTDFSTVPPSSGPHTVTVPLNLVDFPASGAVPGNPVPDFAPLPHLGVKVRNEGHEVSGEFLVDTGAQLSIISTKTALALGLDKDGDGNLDNEALGFADVGGIGGNTSMPIVAVDRLAVPTQRGDSLVWTNMLVGVLDIEVEDGPKLAGVFGMDFLTSGWAAKVLPQLNPDVPPDDSVPDGYFQHLNFDFLDAVNHKGTLSFDLSAVHDNPAAPNPNRLAITYSGLGEVQVESGSGDDWMNVVPSTQVKYVLDAGTQDGLDTLVVRKPSGSAPTNDGAKITIAGYQDILYTHFESVQIPDSDGVAPTVSMAPISPNPRARPVTTTTVNFSEPVIGFDVTDLKLTRDGVTVPLVGAHVRILSSTSYAIEGLSASTGASGEYLLSLVASGSGIVDLSGNPLAAGTSQAWTTRVGFLTESFTTTASGFKATFNAALDPTAINLYATGALGPSDISLVGAATGTVAGSVVIASDGKSITFVRTGGILPPDTYTLTLRSATDAFKSSTLGLLDGNEDGTAGGNFVMSFVVAAPAAKSVVASIPSFVRGPGQDVNVPAKNTTGIPITLSSLDGSSIAVTSVSFSLSYDANLLEVLGVELDPSLPADATITPAFTDTSFTVIIDFPTPVNLSALSQKLLLIEASVPSGAKYGSKEILQFSHLLINSGAVPALAGDGVHLAAYPGDLNLNHGYNAADDLLIRALASSVIGAVPGLPNLDPRIAGDFSGDGRVTSADSLILRAFISGIPVPQIPVAPAGVSVVAGLDPLVWIANDLQVQAGSRLTVPVWIKQTDSHTISLDNYDIAIAYDPAIFTVFTVRSGDLTSSFDPAIVRIDPLTGTLYLSAATLKPLSLVPGQTGILAYLEFDVANDIQGIQGLNLLNTVVTPTGTRGTALNSGGLLLVPAPTDESSDAIDGRVKITKRDRTRATPDPVLPLMPTAVSRSPLSDEHLKADFRPVDQILSSYQSAFVSSVERVTALALGDLIVMPLSFDPIGDYLRSQPVARPKKLTRLFVLSDKQS